MGSPLSRGFWIVLALLHALALAGGVAVGMVLSADLPGLETLSSLQLPQTTLVQDRQGQRLYGFAEQKRSPVPLQKISPTLLKAIIATEDPRFFQHIGLDLQAISRAAFHTLFRMRWGVEGGSTITQQLARDQFLHPGKTLRRKAQEALLALQIEKQYSKQEILELYCNRIYLGHGHYGVEAAARFFFGKSCGDLNLPEAALLAGLPQRPEGLSPLRVPDRALRRRNHVLERMVTEGMLDRRTAELAKQAPLGILADRENPVEANYFVEAVRRWVLKQFGEEDLYRGGLVVQTTLEPRYQAAAQRAVRFGLDALGRRHDNLLLGKALPSGTDPAAYADPGWKEPFRVDDVVNAVVLSSEKQKARLRVRDQVLEFGRREIAWTGRERLDQVLVPRTVVQVRVEELDVKGTIAKADLAAQSGADIALIAMDVASGDILALVGGKNFAESQFDRALQARRQAGSAFKPFIVAAGLEAGFQPGDLLWDRSLVLDEPGLPEPYQPENYDRNYEGLVTLRHTLEHSRNIPTVRLLDALGYDPAVEMARRLGIASDLRPYPSLALGAFEVRLVDLVAAYGAFANGGTLVSPVMVRQVLTAEKEQVWAAPGTAAEAVSPEIAGMMVSLLQGVTQRGTGAAALSLNRPVAGKTGTTDDFTDAWFIGFTPRLAVGVWVGFDERRSLGRGETGGQAALPVWIKFLRDALEGTPAEGFPTPPGLREIAVEKTTGLLPGTAPGCQETLLEKVPAGRPPARACGGRDHLRSTLPYPLQRFPLRADLALKIPPAEAAWLAVRFPDHFQIDPGGRILRYNWLKNRKKGEENLLQGTVALAWQAEEIQAFLKKLPLAREEARLEGAIRKGVDGFPSEIRSINRNGIVRPPGPPEDP